jgi:hypothetical protein
MPETKLAVVELGLMARYSLRACLVNVSVFENPAQAG